MDGVVQDFERVLRNLMGAGTGPGVQIPQTQGAALVRCLIGKNSAQERMDMQTG